MDALKDDLVFQVASYLSPRDLSRLARTCRRFGVKREVRATESLLEEAARRTLIGKKSSIELLDFHSDMYKKLKVRYKIVSICLNGQRGSDDEEGA